MFHNISNPKWFGNWSRLEDDYLGNGGTDIADNFTFSKMEKTGGLFGSIIRLATAFPACDPETGRERRKRRTMRSRHHRLQRLRETGKLFSSQDAADAAASPLSGHRKRPGTRCASQTSIVWGQHRKSRP